MFGICGANKVFAVGTITCSYYLSMPYCRIAVYRTACRQSMAEQRYGIGSIKNMTICECTVYTVV